MPNSRDSSTEASRGATTGMLHQLPHWAKARVVATADHEGVEPLLFGGDRRGHDLGLGEVLRGVVVDVSWRMGEVADLDLGGVAQARPQGVGDQVVVRVRSERVQEQIRDNGALLSRCGWLTSAKPTSDS